MCLPCAYVADTHFRPKDFYQQVEVFEHFLNHCGVCHVLHCGDFFDSHNVGGEGVSTAEMITHLISIFQKFWFIHFYIVEGNHDQSSLGKPSAIDFFRGIKNVTLITERPQLIRLGPFSMQTCLAIPWVRPVSYEGDPTEGFLTEIQEILEDLPGPIEAFGHLNIREASDHGVGAEANPNTICPNVTQLKSIKNLRSFVGGHIHTRQVLAEGIEILGAFNRLKFGEKDNPNGWKRSDCCGNTYHSLEYGNKYYVITEPEQLNREYDNYSSVQLDLEVLGPGYSVDDVQGNPKEVVVKKRKLVNNPSRVSNKVIKTEFKEGRQLRDYLISYVNSDAVKCVPGFEQSILQRFDDLNLAKWKEFGVSKIAEIISVKLDNSYKDQIIRFEPGWNGIVGNFGSGKSILMESAYAGIYGSFLSADRKLNDIFVGENGSIVVKFRDIHGDIYKVVRNVNPNMLSVTKNGLTFIKGGEGQYVKAQTALNNVVGSKEVWRKTSLFTQSREDDFVNSTDSDRYKMFLELLNFGDLSQANQRVDSALKSVESQFKTVDKEKEQHIQAYKMLEEYRAKLEEVDYELNQCRDELEAWEHKEEQPITEEEKLAWNFIYAYENAKEGVSKFESAYGKVEDFTQEDEEKLEYLQKYTQANVNKQKKYNALHVISQPLSNCGCKDSPLRCPFIDQAVDAKAEMGVVGEQIEQYLAQKEEVSKQIAELETKKERASRRVYVQQLYDYLQEHTEEEYEATKKTVEAYKQRRESSVQRKEAHTALKLKEANLLSSRQVYVNEINRWTRDTKDGKRILEEWHKLDNDMEELLFLKKAFSKQGIQTLVLHNVIPTINYYINMITPEEYGINLRLTTESVSREYNASAKEAIRLLAEKSGWPERDIRACSGGERDFGALLFRLSVLLWLTEGKPPELMILDEPTSALNSNVGSRLLINLLRNLGVKQVILATHDNKLAEEMGTILRL